jgi:hypothetical protein
MKNKYWKKRKRTDSSFFCRVLSQEDDLNWMEQYDTLTDLPYVCFASCRSKFSTKCSQPKINFLFLKIDTLDSSPFELSSVFKKYFVSCYLDCEHCALR